MQRAGVVVALAASALLASPAPPAAAEPPTVTISILSPATINSGQQATLQFRVTNRNPDATSFSIAVAVFGGLSCSGDCDLQREIGPGGTETFNARLAGGNVPPGQTRSGQVRITAEAGGEVGTASRNMTVRGPEQPQVQTVKEISGRVTDQNTGDPVSGATVMIQDAQNRTYQTTSNGSGNFRFLGSEEKPIAPGRISLGAIKNGVTKTTELTAGADQVVTNQRIVLALSPAATPSAEPTPEVTEEPGQETEAPEEPAATTAETPQQQAASNEDSGSGLGSWLLIIMGGLLVALGVGAIVLLLMRRKENADDSADDGAEEEQSARPRAAAPASGVYGGSADQTRVAPMPGSGPADATMVHNPALADAPTMMHNRPLVEDEFADPYGAPPRPPAGPQPPTYGGRQSGWGDDGYGQSGQPTQPAYGAAPSGGYGNAPSSGEGYGAAPSSGGGYGAAPSSGGGYGNAPTSGGGYGNAPASGGGYGGPAGGYGGGYGNAPSSGEGYGGRGYGGQPDASPSGGYPPAGGYGDRYDEPTGRYTGPDAGGATTYGKPVDPYESGSYGGSGGRHGAEPTTYGQEPDYGRTGGGYGAGQGYDGPAAGGGYDSYGSGGGYGQAGYGPGGGYDQSGGYGRSGPGDGGYDQRHGYEGPGGGYGRVPEQPSGPGGYGGGYEQQGGYYGGHGQGGERPAPPQQGRSERRSLDWLDD